jgi:hypothetical protein
MPPQFVCLAVTRLPSLLHSRWVSRLRLECAPDPVAPTLRVAATGQVSRFGQTCSRPSKRTTTRTCSLSTSGTRQNSLLRTHGPFHLGWRVKSFAPANDTGYECAVISVVCCKHHHANAHPHVLFGSVRLRRASRASATHKKINMGTRTWHERGGSGVGPRRNPQPAIDGHSPGEDLTERTMSAPERCSRTSSGPRAPERSG